MAAPTIAQAHEDFGFDGIEQLADFFGGEHRRLAFANDMLGTAHRMCRIDFENVAGHQSVEQHAESGQVLLDGRGGKVLFEGFQETRHMDRIDGRKLL